jgi:hypothetical protein
MERWYNMDKKLPTMNVHAYVRSLQQNKHLCNNFLNYSIDRSYENVDHNFDTRFYLEDCITALPTYDFMHHLRRILALNHQILSVNAKREESRVIVDIVHV